MVEVFGIYYLICKKRITEKYSQYDFIKEKYGTKDYLLLKIL